MCCQYSCNKALQNHYPRFRGVPSGFFKGCPKALPRWIRAKDKAEPVRVDKAFPAIVSKTQFRRVNRLMHSRAPKKAHPRRVGSSYLLSGLVKCRKCNRALSGQDSKSGRFSYYVCQSLQKRGSGACDAPRLNPHPPKVDAGLCTSLSRATDGPPQFRAIAS